ncbi:MAG TPA: VOC family protein, partial [Devosia sp.]|nr:VOC family protein [Devosia sp.]
MDCIDLAICSRGVPFYSSAALGRDRGKAECPGGADMINHTGINVTDLARAKVFYVACLATLGMGVKLDLGNAIGFGRLQPRSGDDPGGAFWISQGHPHEPRVHIAFTAMSKEEVVAFYEAALGAGGRDN